MPAFVHPDEWWVLLQAIIALVLGGALGWERETSGKWAGFRTHMLVCVAAMLFVRLGQMLIADTAAANPAEIMRADPTNLIQAIATGVAFLGAGTVFRDRDGARMRGLTTAASLLAVASIGVAVAIDRYVIAVGITLICLFILRTLQRLEEAGGVKTEA